MEHRTLARAEGAITLLSDTGQRTAEQITAGFLAGYKKLTREAYSIDLRLWGRFLAAHGIDPLLVERAHIELWMRQ